MSWRKNYLALDTETTGLDGKARIIEIAFVKFTDGVVTEEWSALFDVPDLDWNDPGVQRALEVNQITREQLKGKPRFAEVLPEMLDRLACQFVWVAHNADFDIRMIRQELERAGSLVLPDALVLDTMCLDQKINKTPIVKGAHTVASVASRWNVAVDGAAHRAATDARTSGLILQEMIRGNHLPEEEPEMREMQKTAATHWQSVSRHRRR
jgi:DNA polymerase III epsilon subunit-like protein